MKRWFRLAAAAMATFVMLAPVAAEAASTTLRLPGGETMVVDTGMQTGSFLRKRQRATANPFARQVVQVQVEEGAGTISVDTRNHFL